MYLIVGLGNPGKQYRDTRHNIGFEAIERIASAFHIPLDQKRHRAIYGTGSIQGQKILLAQPQTYMNLSGESVRLLLDFYKLTPEQLLIIYDDASLSLGQMRIRTQGSAGGHNGIKSIIAHTGTQVFKRIKIGIDEKPPGWDLADYVLSRFSEVEQKVLTDVLSKVVEASGEIVLQGVEKAMNKFNAHI